MPADPDQPPPPAAEDTNRAQLPHRSKSGADLPPAPREMISSASFQETAFAFLTGRKASGALDGDRTAQLIAAYGPSTRDPSRVDVTAAAKGLNVTPRSVRRWLAGGGMSPAHAAKLQRTSRQTMTTKRGRERVMRAARASGAAQRPPGKTGLKIGGTQGVTSGTTDAYRDRVTNVGFSNEDLEAMQDLWVEHGSAGAAAFLHQQMDQHYCEGWQFLSIDDLDWGDSTNY